jgi:spermidine/putrescine transport system ATP-binding protein
MNLLQVTVESVLFDGAASRLIVHPKGSDQQLTVALPQTREYDYIAINDNIEIGWDLASPVLFKQEGMQS